MTKINSNSILIELFFFLFFSNIVSVNIEEINDNH